MRRRLLIAFTACALCALSFTGQTAGSAKTVTIKIIGFNDYHGNVQSPGTFGVNTLVPVAARPAVGGAARRNTAVDLTFDRRRHFRDIEVIPTPSQAA